MKEHGKDYIINYPHMMKIWSKNNTLDPKIQSAGSAKKALWVCELGHEWSARILTIKYGAGCRICNNKELLTGFNDLKTKFPEIAKLFDEKLNGIKTSEILQGNNNKFWIKCENYNHSYISTIYHLREGKRCSYCAGRKVLKGFNDFPTTSPHLLEWWDYNKNDKLPSEFSRGSHTKVWWICPKNNHSFYKTLLEMNKNTACGYCSNNVILSGYNDMATLRPDFLEWWDYEKNNLDPTKISAWSNKKIWAKCSLNHSWQTTGNKMSSGYRCPYCSNNKILYGFNDLETQRPQSLKYWNYEKNKINPSEITARNGKKVWWICNKNKNHEWKAAISDVAGERSGCPHCAKHISKFEKNVDKFIRSLGENTEMNNRSIISPKELDIVIESKKIAIECNGDYWHSDETIRKYKNMSAKNFHTLKKDLAKDAGYDLFFCLGMRLEDK